MCCGSFRTGRRANYRRGAAAASVVTTRKATRQAAKTSPAYQARDSRVLMLSFPPGWNPGPPVKPSQVFQLTKTAPVSRTETASGSDRSHTRSRAGLRISRGPSPILQLSCSRSNLTPTRSRPYHGDVRPFRATLGGELCLRKMNRQQCVVAPPASTTQPAEDPGSQSEGSPI